MKKIIGLLILGLMFSSSMTFAQETTTVGTSLSPIPVISNGALPVDFIFAKTLPDNVGTDVENMYDISIDYSKDSSVNRETPFIIMFLINDREWQGLRNQKLPIVNYKINLKGLADIKHR